MSPLPAESIVVNDTHLHRCSPVEKSNTIGREAVEDNEHFSLQQLPVYLPGCQCRENLPAVNIHLVYSHE